MKGIIEGIYKALKHELARRKQALMVGTRAVAATVAAIIAGAGVTMSVFPRTYYSVECYDSAGNLRWRDGFWNIVVTVGKNKLLDAAFKTGLSSPAWYVGLKGSGSMVAGDTMSSHSGWSELTTYTEANRQAFTPGTIASGSVDNSAAKATFSINATQTITGAFLVDNNTKGGTSGTLYGGGDFSTARDMLNGDTLTVTMTLTA